MTKSIIQSCKSCYIDGKTKGLHKHHIFNGPLRNFSEKEGLWVYLEWSVHRNLHDTNELEHELKRVAQYYYELNHTREEFMKHVHKNYLAEPLNDEEKAKYHIEAKEYNILNDDIKFGG